MEILEARVAASEWYSVVICQLDELVSIRDIGSRVYKEKKDGGYEQSHSGQYITRYTTVEDYRAGIETVPTAKFTTPQVIYNDLSTQQKSAVDAIKSLMNEFPCAMFWHDGNSDHTCNFHGLHIHLLLGCNQGKLSGVHKYRMVREKLKKLDIDIKTQNVRNMTALGRHLMKKPRMLNGCNNMQLCVMLRQHRALNTANKEVVAMIQEDFEKDEIGEQIPDKKTVECTAGSDWLAESMGMISKSSKEAALKRQAEMNVPRMGQYIQQMANVPEFERRPAEECKTFKQIVAGVALEKKIPVSKTANKVDTFKGLILKHNRRTQEDLLTAIVESENREELELYRTLKLGPGARDIFQQALEELNCERKMKGDTYVDILLDNIQAVEGTMSIAETSQIFINWCREQKVIAGELLFNWFLVLDKALPKINCLLLQGESNSGKTFWTQMAFQFPDLIGQTIQSNDFAFMNCAGKSIIQIPVLSITKPEQIEEAKKIFEGLETRINIKNKGPHRLERTPVIVTCNQFPWSNYGNESAAFLNRMFAYRNLRRSKVLEAIKGKTPDARFLASVFGYLRENVMTRITWPPEVNSDEYMMACDLTSQFVLQLTQQGVKTLGDIIEEDVNPDVYRKNYNNDIEEDRLRALVLESVEIEEFSGVPQALYQRAIGWLQYLSRTDARDYYWVFTDYKNPRLVSVLTGQNYNPHCDIDETDYRSFKGGYAIIERLLIRTRSWPEALDAKCNILENKKAMVRTALARMSQMLLWILRETCSQTQISVEIFSVL